MGANANTKSSTSLHIGTLNEGPLHAALKTFYAGVEDAPHAFEVPVGRYLVDVKVGDVFYEVQTGSFSGLAAKMRALAEEGPTVLIHPIAAEKYLINLDEEAALADDPKATKRRRSPRKGHPSHIVNELIYLPGMLELPNLSVEVVLTHEEVWRTYDARKRRGRGGWRTRERRLLEVVSRTRFDCTADLYQLLAAPLSTPFSTAELATALDQPVEIGRRMAYCLREAGVIEICGKLGNALLYQDAE